MPVTNEILPFCPTDSGTNLLTQVEYDAATDRTIGNQPGIASSKLNNKALRQSSFVTSQLAQYISDTLNESVLDNGVDADILDQIERSLAAPTSSRYVSNLGLAASVAANALTISLKTFNGSAPSAGSPVKLAFRNSTSATGQYTVVSVTSALTVVVPSSATLGQISGKDQYVWIYAIYDGTNVQLGVSGVNVFSEASTQSTTAISAGSTSGTVLYSTSAVSSKAIRIIGRLLVNEATAGTWATTPSEVSLLPVPFFTTSEWSTAAAIAAPTATTSGTPAFGTTTTNSWRYRRLGKEAEFEFRLVMTTGGTAGTGDYVWTLPGSLSFDTAFYTAYSTTGSTIISQAASYPALVPAMGHLMRNSNTAYMPTPQIFVFAATTFRISGGINFTGFDNWGSNFCALSNTAIDVAIRFTAPILGWSDYGP